MKAEKVIYIALKKMKINDELNKGDYCILRKDLDDTFKKNDIIEISSNFYVMDLYDPFIYIEIKKENNKKVIQYVFKFHLNRIMLKLT